MDPSLFRIDWAILSEALAAIIVLSFFVERALSLVFEHKLYLDRLKDKGLKEPIALALSYAVVSGWNFDALAVIMRSDENTMLGYLLTAAIVAGGSKASIKLFHDLLDVKSQTLRARQSEEQESSKLARKSAPKDKGIRGQERAEGDSGVS